MRKYLGASQWSHCDRKMWFAYRSALKIEHERERKITLMLGDAVEEIVISILENDGAIVTDKQKCITNKYGRVLGHIDGVIDGMLLEIKSANQRNFTAYKKEIPDYYYTQVQIYMRKLNLNQCRFIVLNKNTSEIWEKIIDADSVYADLQIKRIESVIDNEDLPSGDESWKCKMCDYQSLCASQNICDVSCGTCAHISARDGLLVCDNGRSVSYEQSYPEPCMWHIMHPSIMKLAGYEMLDFDEKNQCVEYKELKNGGNFMQSQQIVEFFRSKNGT